MRQVGDGPFHHGAGAEPAGEGRGGRNPVRRTQPARLFRGADAQGARQRRVDDLPGADDLAEPGFHHRASDRRGGDPAPEGVQKGGAGTFDRDAAPGGYPRPGTALRRVSAPAFRRHAPARDDCHGPFLQPEAADSGRADHRAGRNGAGTDSGADDQAAGRAGNGNGDDHARSGGDCRGVRPRGDHVRGKGGGIRRRRFHLLQPEAPLHDRTAPLHSPTR